MRGFGAALLLLAAPFPALAQRDPTIRVPAADPEMQAAIAKARAGLPVFFGHATAPGPREGGFIVKFALVPGPAAEFVWADVIAHRGDTSVVRIANTPNDRRFARGQQLSVRDRDLIDWAYYRGGVLQGGATMRVLLARMPAAEAREMRRSFGW